MTSLTLLMLILPHHLFGAAEITEPELIAHFISLSQRKQNKHLLHAAKHGKTHHVHLLLACKADIEATNKLGNSSLCLAALNGHKEIVELLIQHKAHINSPNDEQSLPIHAAADNNSCAKSIVSNKIAILQLLLQNGAFINAQNNSGITPMHLAASSQDAEIVRFLAQEKAAIDIGTTYKAQPLHWAAMHGNIEATQFLLEQNISTTILDKQHDTPLHWAAQKGHPELVQLLLTDESIKQQPALEHERIIQINASLANLPSALMPLIIGYKGLETETEGVVTDFKPASMALQNQDKHTAIACAQEALTKTDDLNKQIALNQCIELLASHYSRIMHSLITHALSK